MKIKISNDRYLSDFVQFMYENGQKIKITPLMKDGWETTIEGEVEIEDSKDLSERLKELVGFEVELKDLEKLIPRTPLRIKELKFCPRCYKQLISQYCWNCGQKISEEK